MAKIFKYLKPHVGAVLAILLLLIVQANCELSLPAYTSDIVNVGIALKGVEDTVPKHLSEETMMGLMAAGNEQTKDIMQQSYVKNEQGYFDLRENADTGILHDFFVSMMPNMPEENRDSALGQLCVSEYEKVGMDLSKTQLSYVLNAGGKMLLLAFAAMACAILVGLLASRTAAGVGMRLREQVFENVVHFSNVEMEKFSTASLITRSTNDIQQVQMVTVMLLRMVLYAPILGIGGVFKVLQTNVSMSYIIAVAVMCVIGVVAVLFVVAMPKFKLMQKLVDRVNLVAREILTGLSVIRAFSREKFEEDRFDKANRDLMKTQLFTNRAMTFMMPVMMLIMNGVSLAIVWFGGKGIDAGSLQVGDMMAFMTYSMQIIMSFLMITMISIMLPRAGVAAERIDEVIQTTSSIHNPKEPKKIDAENIKGELEFHDVSFAYPD
ncbi:MAG: ABC transporter permease, partial [Lachnospiraceae bacterium]